MFKNYFQPTFDPGQMILPKMYRNQLANGQTDRRKRLDAKLLTVKH